MHRVSLKLGEDMVCWFFSFAFVAFLIEDSKYEIICFIEQKTLLKINKWSLWSVFFSVDGQLGCRWACAVFSPHIRNEFSPEEAVPVSCCSQ